MLADKAIVTFQYNRHTAQYCGSDSITIGCHTHSIDHWLANFEQIGAKENYTAEEIKRYGRFIKSCARDYKRSKK